VTTVERRPGRVTLVKSKTAQGGAPDDIRTLWVKVVKEDQKKGLGVEGWGGKITVWEMKIEGTKLSRKNPVGKKEGQGDGEKKPCVDEVRILPRYPNR